MSSPTLIPAPTDPYEGLQWNMIRAHETFKIGYGRIYRLLQDPPRDDLYNFLGYLEAWAKAIVTHHDTEELSVFPFLATKMDISQEQEDHKVIHSGLTTFIEYVTACQSNPDTFDAKKALTMIEEMKGPLFSHLDGEVEHIGPEVLKEAGFTPKDLTAMLNSLVSEGQKHGSPFLLLPFMLSHTPPEHKIWPVAPWIIRKVAIPYVFAPRYRGYWKWAPYGFA